MAQPSAIYSHFQTSALDVYVDSYSVKEPEIPGMGETRYIVAISAKTTDEETESFAVQYRIQMEDGTFTFTNQTVVRDSHPGAYTVVRVPVTGKPVKIVALYVIRTHWAATDTLVHYPGN